MHFIMSAGNYNYYWRKTTKEITQERDPYYQIIGYAETMTEARNIINHLT